ncbi:MAG: hypothetical protein ACRD8O_02730 [Bryobacteraceae bacterium]
MAEGEVRAHVSAESRHDVDATIATFHPPHYEVIPMGVVSNAKLHCAD